MFNGSTNFETWTAYNYLQYPEEIYRETMATIKNTAKDIADKEEALNAVARSLEDVVRASAPNLEGLYGSLLEGALVEINFREVAEAFLEDMD